MKNKIRVWNVMALLSAMLFMSEVVFAEGRSHDRLPVNEVDSVLLSHRFTHGLGLEFRPGYIIPTNSFLEGENGTGKSIKNTFSAHLKYSLGFQPNTYIDRVYGGVYQGLGLAYYSFGESKQLGDPVALYLFQGARIARFSPWLTLNYEWNFGLSGGWKPYDSETNSYNKVIGSKMNAYINTNFYLSWMLSRRFDLTTGVTLTHFSNGNTKFPNAGLNAVGLKVGLAYNFNRTDHSGPKSLYRPPVPVFPQHISYDLVLFGSWRRKGVITGNEQVASPKSYEVLGFNFAPMYNFGYKFRAGVSLDGVYDGSANIFSDGFTSNGDQKFSKPSLVKQLSLGVSARAEYVMPYFTVGIGLGTNVLQGGGDLNAFYQILALKIEMTKSSFIHIGYSLQDFHNPNFLMLGIGFRFNNKYPTLHR